MAEVYVVPTTATGASLAYDLVSQTAGYQYVKLVNGDPIIVPVLALPVYPREGYGVRSIQTKT